MQSPLEKKFARVKIRGQTGTKLIERTLLTLAQRKSLDSSPLAFVHLDFDPSVSPLPPSILPCSPSSPVPLKPNNFITMHAKTSQSTGVTPFDLENIDDKKARIQAEQDRRLGEAIRNVKLVENSDYLGPGNKEKDVPILVSLVDQLSKIKLTLGPLASGTLFGSPLKTAAILTGVSERTIYRKMEEGKSDTSRRDEEKERKMRKRKDKKRILDLISDDERKKIFDFIQEKYELEDNFTLSSLLADLKKIMDFRFGQTTLWKILHAMDLSYKLKTFNAMSNSRYDLIAWRGRYLKKIEELRETGAFITYFDESWVYHGITKKFGWSMKHKNAYELARIGSLKNPLPGFKVASDKGVRAVVLSVLTESCILPSSIKVLLSKQSAANQLLDYHQNMDSAAYKEYMELILPDIAAAAPPGRRPILIIDNAPVHNKTVIKTPVSRSTKTVLAQFLESHGVAFDPHLSQPELWAEVEDYISTHGGRSVVTRYVVDEMAEQFGVEIVRLPPYHCFLNPIELVWGQLKGHLRKVGKPGDKVEIVRDRTVQFLSSIPEQTIANTIEHVIELEQDVKAIMDAEYEELGDQESDEDDMI